MRRVKIAIAPLPGRFFNFGSYHIIAKFEFSKEIFLKMNGRFMGIILIIIGGLILTLGIVIVSKRGNPEMSAETKTAKDILLEKEAEAPVTPKEKGDAFENYIINLLADWRFTLLDRTQDKVSSEGVVAESSKNPDLWVQQKRGKGNVDYFMECKYRSNWKDGKVEFEDWQVDRYRKFQREKHRKVIIALGMEGTADSPSTLMLVPVDSLKNNSIRKIDTYFKIQGNSDSLYDYMDNYFTEVFQNAKEKKETYSNNNNPKGS